MALDDLITPVVANQLAEFGPGEAAKAAQINYNVPLPGAHSWDRIVELELPGSLARPATRSPHAAGSRWRSPAGLPPARCCAPWPARTCPGRRSTSSRSTSGSRPPGTPTATSSPCARSSPTTSRCRRPTPTPCPVEADDLEAAARAYADELAGVCGNPPILDLVHLGLDDGHTASWPPGDPIAAIVDAEVAICPVYRGRRRMTLTVPAVNRARAVLWLVSGPSKADMLARVFAGDPALPASLVRPDQALVLADRAAAQRVASTNWNE